MYGFYDYYEEVEKDVREYINENIDLESVDFDELEEQLQEELINADSVTGNISGSYTFNQCKAQEYVEDNKDLVREMCYAFCNEQDVMKWWFEDNYELIDVSIRCYVLSDAIHNALIELREAAE